MIDPDADFGLRGHEQPRTRSTLQYRRPELTGLRRTSKTCLANFRTFGTGDIEDTVTHLETPPYVDTASKELLVRDELLTCLLPLSSMLTGDAVGYNGGGMTMDDAVDAWVSLVDLAVDVSFDVACRCVAFHCCSIRNIVLHQVF